MIPASRATSSTSPFFESCLSRTSFIVAADIRTNPLARAFARSRPSRRRRPFGWRPLRRNVIGRLSYGYFSKAQQWLQLIAALPAPNPNRVCWGDAYRFQTRRRHSRY